MKSQGRFYDLFSFHRASAAAFLRRCFFVDVFKGRRAQGGDIGHLYFREAIGWRLKRKKKR